MAAAVKFKPGPVNVAVVVVVVVLGDQLCLFEGSRIAAFRLSRNFTFASSSKCCCC